MASWAALRRPMVAPLVRLPPLHRAFASAPPPAAPSSSDAVHPPSHIEEPVPSSSGAPAAAAPTYRELPPRSWLAPSDKLAYRIPRNRPFGTLPVYTKIRPAKKSAWTLIRKVEGSLEDLKRHVLLDFPHSYPVIKENARALQLRGKVVSEVKLWLSDRGF